jgi:hypothetical protein
MRLYDRAVSAATLLGIGLLLVIEVAPLAHEVHELTTREAVAEEPSEVLERPLPQMDRVSLGDPYELLYGWSDVFQALRVVETGGQPNAGVGAVGDNGNAYGPYQIWMPYFADATERQYEDIPTQDISWEDCLNDTYSSELVVLAYMRRYAKHEYSRLAEGTATIADVEKIARIHNGGPRGHSKSATLGYWAKVQEVL